MAEETREQSLKEKIEEIIKSDKNFYEGNKRWLRYEAKEKFPNTKDINNYCECLTYSVGRIHALEDVLEEIERMDV